MVYLITLLGTQDKLEHFTTFEVKGRVGGNLERLNVPKTEPTEVEHTRMGYSALDYP